MPGKEYIFKNARVASITFADLLKLSSNIDDLNKSSIADIQPRFLEINSGVFFKATSTFAFPDVAVNQVGNSVILFCSCTTTGYKICQHQAQVLFAILEQPDFRIFYDDVFRQNRLLTVAKDYGLENEVLLDDYFLISYENKSLHIQPKIKELFKVDVAAIHQKLLPKNDSKNLRLPDIESDKRSILVLRNHKYYEQLIVEIYEGVQNKSGKLKNPLNPIDPIKQVWKCNSIEEAKFFTAVSKFKHNYAVEEEESNLEALQILVKNVLQYDTFFHDKSVSDNVNANSLIPIYLSNSNAKIVLSVFKKDPFYEITGGLNNGSNFYSFKELLIRYNYFIQYGQCFSLLANVDMLRVIHFFKSNHEILLIHASKYEEFKNTILSNLERQVSINYAYIHSATKEQLVEHNFDNTVERIIYLSDHEQYVGITPVMKYGNIEIPVFSKKQIFDTDQNGNVFKVDRDEDKEARFTSILMRQHPDFAEQIYEHSYFYLHKKKFLDEDWFLKTFEEWRNNQIKIFGFNEIKNQKKNAYTAVVSVGINSGIDWFNTTVKVEFDNKQASLKQLHKSIRNKTKYVQLDDGTVGIIPVEWFKKLEEYFKHGEIEGEILKIPKNNFTAIQELFEDEVLPKEIFRELKIYHNTLLNKKNIPDIPVPEGLQATLRAYQKDGLNWLNYLDDHNFGACLADDMGLGKTLQIIAFILTQRRKQIHNTNLVVVPTSLLFNWQLEVEKFAPSIKIFTHYGISRNKITKDFDSHEIILTTYGILLSDIKILSAYKFNYIFLDESQAIKNPNSERYKAARLLKSRNKVVLTGTPIENNTFDLYGQLSFACPGLFGSKQHFKDLYAMPIDKFDDNKRAAELRKKTQPFILRRTKKQVAEELPEKTEMVIYCEMGESQRKIYNAYETELREYIAGKREDDVLKSTMHVLKGLTKLRQICNSPALLKDEAHFGDHAAKIDVLLEQIENNSSQHKILVFSQFVSMLDLIKNALQKKDISYEYLTGQTRDRAAVVNNFQNNKNIRVFLISLKAGGIGLNLTEADYVYLIDPWWNPAIENQAIDRCYRIGQKKNVVAVRLICPDTVEEKILKLQKSKADLANNLIQTDRAIFKNLSKKDLLDIL